MTHRILILGGTTEARQLAGMLSARADLAITLSLAGRTESPVAQGVPIRSGGFGGVKGLSAYLNDMRIDLLIDDASPAAQISANAAEVARKTGMPISPCVPAGGCKATAGHWSVRSQAVECLDRAAPVFLRSAGRVAAFEAARNITT